MGLATHALGALLRISSGTRLLRRRRAAAVLSSVVPAMMTAFRLHGTKLMMDPATTMQDSDSRPWIVGRMVPTASNGLTEVG